MPTNSAKHNGMLNAKVCHTTNTPIHKTPASTMAMQNFVTPLAGPGNQQF
jgi:hypothetical protein